MTVLLQPQPLVLCTHSHTSHLTPVFSIISPPIDDIIACAGFAVLFVHFQIKIFTISKGAEQLALIKLWCSVCCEISKNNLIFYFYMILLVYIPIQLLRGAIIEKKQQ